MAFRRSALERAGLLDPETGRKAGTLLGQEVREWCIRARKAGVRGFYVPDMVVEHVIPAERLTKSYFRRWFYWRGVSRAILYQRAGLDMESPEDSVVDPGKARHVLGVPPYMYVRALRSCLGWVSGTVRRRRVQAFEHETWLWFFAGVVRQRLKDFRVRSVSNGKLQESALHASPSRHRVS
jgi:hypothetical protein